MNYPLITVACRHLGNEKAMKIYINIAETWAKEGVTGLDWFRGFMTRQ
jgi:hypothetical protein